MGTKTMLKGGLFILTLAVVMAVSGATGSGSGVAVPATAQAEEGAFDVKVKGPGSRIRMQTITDVFRQAASGTAWLVAEGLDPRLLKRPGWDVMTRLAWRDLEGPFISAGPTLQQPGGGVLVPFRDPAPAFSRTILLTRDFGNSPFQTEPHMAVNPSDPKHIVVGVIDFNFPSIANYVSFDGGQTWEGPFQSSFVREDLVSAGDPVVAFDRDGNIHEVSISIGIEEFSIGPFVLQAVVSAIAHSESEDGGLSWGESISTARGAVTTDLFVDSSGRPRGQLSLSFLDKPWMAVGPHPTDPDRDVIYVTYTDFTVIAPVLYIGEVPALAVNEVQTTIRLVRSEDGGQTWSVPLSVSPTVRRAAGDAPGPAAGVVEGLKRVVQGSQPRVAPDGTVYVAWMDTTDDDSQKGLAEIYVARSDDAGKTFAEPVNASLFREPEFRSKNAFFRSWASAFPQIAIGPGGEIYVVYVGLNPAKPTDDGDVYFIRSQDRGESWSRAKILGGDETDRFQFFPAIDTDPDGNIYVLWGDMRDDASETRYHIYLTQSEDKGETWGFELPELDFRTEDTRVTDFPSNPNKGFPFGLFIGDYFAISATGDDVYAVWADARLGEFGAPNQKIGFARRSVLTSVEVFLSPAAGPGGQEVTLQGFNFQPNLNVFVQVGGVAVATVRTDDEGQFTARLFMPVSGEGAQDVRVFDESGNLATTSFFAEFGFGSIRDLQRGVEAQLEELTRKIEASERVEAAQLGAELQRVRVLLEDEGQGNDGGNTPWWAVVLSAVGAAGLAAVGAAYLTITLQARRRRSGSLEEGS